jgi:uncharacterized membrane protein YhaH (DUF805 family)
MQLFSGRINRKNYFIAFFLYFILCAAIEYFIRSKIDLIIKTILVILILPILSLMVKRGHDFGLSGWLFLILGIIPDVNGIFGLLLFLIPGNKTENKFGSLPPNKLIMW